MPPIIGPVLFGGALESSLSNALSGSEVGVGGPADSKGLEDSADEESVSGEAVGRVPELFVGVGKRVCVRAVAPQAMYEKAASSLRANITVEQN